jgi:hypothetical protein
MPVSLDTLQAVLTGTRKFPTHKLGYLKRYIEHHTGRAARAIIDELARQHGGIYVEVDGVGEGSLLEYIREFSEGAAAASACLADAMVTDDELGKCERDLRQAASAALSLLAHIEALHKRGAIHA